MNIPLQKQYYLELLPLIKTSHQILIDIKYTSNALFLLKEDSAKELAEKTLTLFRSFRVDLAFYIQLCQDNIAEISGVKRQEWLYKKMLDTEQNYKVLREQMPHIPHEIYERVKKGIEDGCSSYSEQDYAMVDF